jgi:hypothetical protein
MQISMTTAMPKEWASKKPIESYETTFLATGFSRYNTVKKTLSQFVRHDNGTVTYSESTCAATVFPRVYHTEPARVTVYSRSPMVWTEEVDGLQCFIQVQSNGSGVEASDNRE